MYNIGNSYLHTNPQQQKSNNPQQMPQQLPLPATALKQPPRNKTSDKCQQCSTEFTLTKREHLCKRCYRFVCDACSPYKEKVYKANMMHRLHRLCSTCYTESQILGKYVQVNKVSWAEDSDMGRLWVRQAGFQRQFQAKRKTEGRKKMVEYALTPETLWASFNYSFRQLIGRAIDQSKKFQQPVKKQKQKQRSQAIHQKATTQILQLLSILTSQLPPSLVPTLNPSSTIHILIFFLIHCSPQNALSLTKSALQYISLHQVEAKNVCFYLEKLDWSQGEIYRVEDFLEGAVEKVGGMFGVNYFSVEVSIEIVGGVFGRKNFGEIQKAIAYLVNRRKEFILANVNKSLDLIQIDLLRNHEGLGDGYKKFLKQLGTTQSPSPTKQKPQLQQQQQQVNNSKQQQSQQSPNHHNPNSSQKPKQKQPSLQELKKQNEQLKIKNKNQQDEINRLKKQNKKLMEREKLLGEEIKKHMSAQYRANNNNGNNNNKGGKEKEKEKDRNQSQQYQFSNQKDVDSENSYQSYWEEVDQGGNQIQMEIVENPTTNDKDSQKISSRIKKIAKATQPPQFKQFDTFNQVLTELTDHNKSPQNLPSPQSSKKKKLVKKYRKKSNHTRLNRLSTQSEQLVKQIQQFNKYNENQGNYQLKMKYQQIIYNKNQEISMLGKQLDIIKYSAKLREEEDKAKDNRKQKTRSPSPAKLPLHPQPHLNSIPAPIPLTLSLSQQNTKIKAQLQTMQQMNKKLLLKIKQLSNMLMDKQEEQVKESQSSLEELVQIYEEQTKDPNQECSIF